MKKTLILVKALSPYFRGVLGAATVAVGIYLGGWLHTLYVQHTRNTQVVDQLIENSLREQAKQEAAKKAEKP